MNVSERFMSVTFLRPEKLKNGHESWTFGNGLGSIKSVGRPETIAKSRSRSRFKNERITDGIP
jgi:hypothetical protein